MLVENPECHISNHTRRVRSVQTGICAEVWYAASVGLEPDVVRFEWPEASAKEKEGMGAIEAWIKNTLMQSVGVRR
jgi:hypothetical protein